MEQQPVSWQNISNHIPEQSILTALSKNPLLFDSDSSKIHGFAQQLSYFAYQKQDHITIKRGIFHIVLKGSLKEMSKIAKSQEKIVQPGQIIGVDLPNILSIAGSLIDERTFNVLDDCLIAQMSQITENLDSIIQRNTASIVQLVKKEISFISSFKLIDMVECSKLEHSIQNQVIKANKHELICVLRGNFYYDSMREQEIHAICTYQKKQQISSSNQQTDTPKEAEKQTESNPDSMICGSETGIILRITTSHTNPLATSPKQPVYSIQKPTKSVNSMLKERHPPRLFLPSSLTQRESTTSSETIDRFNSEEKTSTKLTTTDSKFLVNNNTNRKPSFQTPKVDLSLFTKRSHVSQNERKAFFDCYSKHQIGLSPDLSALSQLTSHPPSAPTTIVDPILPPAKRAIDTFHSTNNRITTTTSSTQSLHQSPFLMSIEQPQVGFPSTRQKATRYVNHVRASSYNLTKESKQSSYFSSALESNEQSSIFEKLNSERATRTMSPSPLLLLPIKSDTSLLQQSSQRFDHPSNYLKQQQQQQSMKSFMNRISTVHEYLPASSYSDKQGIYFQQENNTTGFPQNKANSVQSSINLQSSYQKNLMNQQDSNKLDQNALQFSQLPSFTSIKNEEKQRIRNIILSQLHTNFDPFSASIKHAVDKVPFSENQTEARISTEGSLPKTRIMHNNLNNKQEQQSENTKNTLPILKQNSLTNKLAAFIPQKLKQKFDITHAISSVKNNSNITESLHSIKSEPTPPQNHLVNNFTFYNKSFFSSPQQSLH